MFNLLHFLRSYVTKFEAVFTKNYPQHKEDLKIIVCLGVETPTREVIINQNGTRIILDGEGKVGLQKLETWKI